jgi:mitogen-activated protein kinase organizer 1
MKKQENRKPGISSVRSLLGHQSGVNVIKFTKDGNYCVSCSDDRTIKLWNPHRPDPSNDSNGLLIKTYSGVHGYQVLDTDVSYVCYYLSPPILTLKIG